jgi:acetyl-CoA/propionyl-CoA carboxylase biotin carboxyl carrier protein
MADGVVEVQMPQMGESVTEGTILEWHVSEGQEVAEGDTVVVLEAMKMENNIGADKAGKVTAVKVAVGDSVGAGDIVVEID